MKNLAYLILGDNPEHLRQHTVQSRRKIQVLAWSIVVSTFLWFIIGFFTARNLMSQGCLISTLTGCVTGFLVFIMDRSIALSSRSIPLFIYRSLLGLVIAVLGSVLLDSILLSEDIDYYMTKKGQALADSAYSKAIKNATPEVDRQKQQVQEKYALYVARQNNYEKEVDGTGGSQSRGKSIIANEKEKLMNSAQSDFIQSQKDLVHLQVEVVERAEKLRSESLENTGKKTLLYRIQCLEEFISSNQEAKRVYWMLFAFNFLLEIGVIFFKMFGRKTSYELEVERAEEIRNKRSEQILKAQTAHFESQARVGFHGSGAHRAVWGER